MTTHKPTLRIVRDSSQESPAALHVPRERNAAARASQAAHELPAAVAEWLQRFADAWLQEHAAPHVDAWLEDRANVPILLGIPRVAKALDLSNSTVQRMIADGELPTVSVGSRVLVRRADLERWASGLPTLGEAAR